MAAPQNPYRDERRLYEDTARVAGSTPRPAGMGPGLLGADLDHIARRAYRDGVEIASAEHRLELERVRDQAAVAYDEGYDAGARDRQVAIAEWLARSLRVVAGIFNQRDALSKATGRPKRDAANAAKRDELVGEVRGIVEELRRAMEDELPERPLVEEGDYVGDPLDTVHGIRALERAHRAARVLATTATNPGQAGAEELALSILRGERDV